MGKTVLVVTDLDGTFLSTDKTIGEENMQAVELLRKNGVRFTICTGRPVAMAMAFIKQLCITEPVIGCNGGVLYDPVQEKVIHAVSFTQQQVAVLAAYSMQEDFDFLAYTVDTVYYTPNSKRIQVFVDYNRYAQGVGVEPAKLCELKDINQLQNKAIVKILITELHNSDLEKMSSFIERKRDISCTPSMSNVLDLMPQGVTKGSGVSELSKYTGITCDDICTFGDNFNDVSMMTCVGSSVCMVNGTDDAKKAATYITKSNNDNGGFADGVRWLLEKRYMGE